MRMTPEALQEAIRLMEQPTNENYLLDANYRKDIASYVRDLEYKVLHLQTAIRKHRDQRGDDRCWLDDVELYRALGEPMLIKDLALPGPCEMMANCVRFIKSRQPDGIEYISPQLEFDIVDAERANYYERLKEAYLVLGWKAPEPPTTLDVIRKRLRESTD